MSSLPEDEPRQPAGQPESDPVPLESITTPYASSALPVESDDADPPRPASVDSLFVSYAPPSPEAPLFQSFAVPPPRPQVRIPHFGSLAFLLLALAPVALLITGLLMGLAMHEHLFGVSTTQQAMANVHYILGSEGLLYLTTFVLALLIFPFFWHEGFFAGVQWNAGTAFHLRWRLGSAAVVCFLLAILSGELFPGPNNTPIEKIFRSPGAAWLLFAFGVTFAPFFEEMLFRGFLLPSICTAYDWLREKTVHEPVPPLGPNGHPQWSLPAMVVGSLLTSLPFAALHGEQTGYALGPFFLLVGVSLVLCFARLATRSLAASVVVHACYNFLLFFVMLVASGGFRHLDKM
jgi:hypothetical protein